MVVIVPILTLLAMSKLDPFELIYNPIFEPALGKSYHPTKYGVYVIPEEIKYTYTAQTIIDGGVHEETTIEYIKSIGGNSIPIIYVDDTSKDTLILRHEHDGRDLELNYADQCVKHISKMWKGPVKLFTILEGDPFEIS